MTWARTVFYPGGTAEQYRAVIDAIGPAVENPPGRIFHAAGPTEGGWILLTVWETKEQFERFAAEHIGPGHQRAGDKGWRTQPQASDFTPEHVIVAS
jgi:hypothetical protein